MLLSLLFIEDSIEKYGLDIKDCFVIGDMGMNEIVMAHNAGCKGVLVLTGGGQGSLGKFRDTWAGYECFGSGEGHYKGKLI